MSNDPTWKEYLPLSQIQFADKNPKDHDIGAIHGSINRFGFVGAVTLDAKTGKLVAGHGRVIALRQKFEAGEPAPKGIVVRDGQWLVPCATNTEFENEIEALAYLHTDNKTTELGGWDEAELAETLQLLAKHDALDDTGFTGDDLDELLQKLDKTETAEGGGDLLAKLGVTLADPETEVVQGDVWQILEKHLLVVCDVIRDVPLWKPHLSDDQLFCPYPGPLLFCSELAKSRLLLGVQPNEYIAGHILDNIKTIEGKQAIKKL